MQTLKQKGFTLIELLVVIVIIGILATISVATFSGYFAKARDSERQSAVRNVATIIKTSRAVETIDSYVLTATGLSTPAGVIEFGTLLDNEGGFSVPAESVTNNEYVYLWATGAGINEFAVLACSEENAGTMIADGTSAGKAAAIAASAALCDLASAVVLADVPAGYGGAIISNAVVAPDPLV